MSKILLVTNKRDLTTDYIVREIRCRSLDFIRLNTEDITQYNITVSENGSEFELISEEISFNLNDVSAAYFRRPETPIISGNNFDKGSTHFAVAEWLAFLKSMYLFLDQRWLSHPLDIMRAEDKLTQLRIASRLGMLVPRGVVTNSFETLRRFSESTDIIGKPLKSALVESDDGGRVVYTSRIHKIDEVDKSSISICPHIYQQEIKKKFDIRVTVVGNLVFPVAIDSQVSDDTSVDWRRGGNPNIPHKIYPIPEDLSQKCAALVKEQGLRFGAIDLIEDSEGKFWFLECNPNGQWAWIENRTGLPISAAIVDEIEKISAS